MTQDKAPEWAFKAAASLQMQIHVNLSTGTAPELDTIALALSQAYERGKSESEANTAEILKDPVAVRVNYLRGGIACQPLIDEAYERGQESMRERASKELDAWKMSKASDKVRSLPIEQEGGE